MPFITKIGSNGFQITIVKDFFDADHFEGLHCYNIVSVLCFWGFFFCHLACGILAPWPGIEPAPPTLKGEVLNHWTTREVPQIKTFNTYSHLGLKINFWAGWTYIIVNILILAKLRDIVTFSKIQTVSGESWSSTEVCSIKIPLPFPYALRLF